MSAIKQELRIARMRIDIQQNDTIVVSDEGEKSTVRGMQQWLKHFGEAAFPSCTCYYGHDHGWCSHRTAAADMLRAVADRTPRLGLQAA